MDVVHVVGSVTHSALVDEVVVSVPYDECEADNVEYYVDSDCCPFWKVFYSVTLSKSSIYKVVNEEVWNVLKHTCNADFIKYSEAECPNLEHYACFFPDVEYNCEEYANEDSSNNKSLDYVAEATDLETSKWVFVVSTSFVAVLANVDDVVNKPDDTSYDQSEDCAHDTPCSDLSNVFVNEAFACVCVVKRGYLCGRAKFRQEVGARNPGRTLVAKGGSGQTRV